jgi:hypothetical protein
MDWWCVGLWPELPGDLALYSFMLQQAAEANEEPGLYRG